MANAHAMLRAWVRDTKASSEAIGRNGATPSQREAHTRQSIIELTTRLDVIEPGLGLRALDALYPNVFDAILAPRRPHVVYEAPLSEQAAQQLQANGLVGSA